MKVSFVDKYGTWHLSQTTVSEVKIEADSSRKLKVDFDDGGFITIKEVEDESK